MFIKEQGTTRYAYLSKSMPFEAEVVKMKDGTGHIYFKNMTEFSVNESRQRFGLYKTVESAERAFERFMEAFEYDTEICFDFENELEQT